MRLLVTGGCGFVGSNFVKYVLQHYGPEMITNVDSLASGGLASLGRIAKEFGERYEFLCADIGDADKIDAVLTTHQYFAVVNFTGASNGGGVGLGNLLERARKHGVRRFVQVSCDATLATAAVRSGQAASDAEAMEARRVHGQEVIVTRSVANYGPFQSPLEFIPSTILHALRDEEVPLDGDGSTQRGWLHVDDHCSGIFAALLSGEPGTIYPLVNEHKVSELDVAQTILEYLGKPQSLLRPQPAHERGPGLPDEEHLAWKQLEWKPRKQLATALRETIDWYVHNREWWEGRALIQPGEQRKIAL
jgi:dTDP-glucose 4,6-dehydratase